LTQKLNSKLISIFCQEFRQKIKISELKHSTDLQRCTKSLSRQG